MDNFNVPILFLIFNRPEETSKVFEEIRKIKPAKLYIAADGPRLGKESDIVNCKKTRTIVNNIDWECQTFTLFRDTNLGCGKAVSSSISWFFNQEEEGIVIEDDCLPHQDFFYYCRDLLSKYRNSDKVMFIGGTNYQQIENQHNNSYYYSTFSHVWGWASWARVWKQYDLDLKRYPKNNFKEILTETFKYNDLIKYWMQCYAVINRRLIDTWDYQLSISILYNKGLCIIPSKNLVSNIGFTTNSTHTNIANSNLSLMSTSSILPIEYNENQSVNWELDIYYYNTYLKDKRSFFEISFERIKNVFKRLSSKK